MLINSTATLSATLALIELEIVHLEEKSTLGEYCDQMEKISDEWFDIWKANTENSKEAADLQSNYEKEKIDYLCHGLIDYDLDNNYGYYLYINDLNYFISMFCKEVDAVSNISSTEHKELDEAAMASFGMSYEEIGKKVNEFSAELYSVHQHASTLDARAYCEEKMLAIFGMNYSVYFEKSIQLRNTIGKIEKKFHEKNAAATTMNKYARTTQHARQATDVLEQACSAKSITLEEYSNGLDKIMGDLIEACKADVYDISDHEFFWRQGRSGLWNEALTLEEYCSYTNAAIQALCNEADVLGSCPDTVEMTKYARRRLSSLFCEKNFLLTVEAYYTHLQDMYKMYGESVPLVEESDRTSVAMLLISELKEALNAKYVTYEEYTRGLLRLFKDIYSGYALSGAEHVLYTIGVLCSAYLSNSVTVEEYSAIFAEIYTEFRKTGKGDKSSFEHLARRVLSLKHSSLGHALKNVISSKDSAQYEKARKLLEEKSVFALKNLADVKTEKPMLEELDEAATAAFGTFYRALDKKLDAHQCDIANALGKVSSGDRQKMRGVCDDATMKVFSMSFSEFYKKYAAFCAVADRIDEKFRTMEDGAESGVFAREIETFSVAERMGAIETAPLPAEERDTMNRDFFSCLTMDEKDRLLRIEDYRQVYFTLFPEEQPVAKTELVKTAKGDTAPSTVEKQVAQLHHAHIRIPEDAILALSYLCDMYLTKSITFGTFYLELENIYCEFNKFNEINNPVENLTPKFVGLYKSLKRVMHRAILLAGTAQYRDALKKISDISKTVRTEAIFFCFKSRVGLPITSDPDTEPEHNEVDFDDDEMDAPAADEPEADEKDEPHSAELTSSHVPVPTPKEICDQLDKVVIGQSAAKLALATAVYDHYMRNKTETMFHVRLKKSNILFLGPTGSGKTLLVRSLAELLDVPFVQFDATSFTEKGYWGNDADQIAEQLILKANGDIDRAEQGICYIDEFDKLTTQSENEHIRGHLVATQQSFLKVIEGCDIFPDQKWNPRAQNAFANPTEAKVKPARESFSTQNVLFIFSGAFEGLEEIIAARLRGPERLGFGSAEAQSMCVDPLHPYAEVTPSDLVEYGLIREMVGRMSRIVALDFLDADALVRVLTEPRDSLLAQCRAMFRREGVELLFTPEAIRAVAEIAVARRTGARGLESILDKFLVPLRAEAASFDHHGAVLEITPEVVMGTAKAEFQNVIPS